MATKAQIMGGLAILARNVPDDDQGFLRVDHDQIWAGYDDGSQMTGLTKDDWHELKRLGWFFDNDAWSHFV